MQGSDVYISDIRLRFNSIFDITQSGDMRRGVHNIALQPWENLVEVRPSLDRFETIYYRYGGSACVRLRGIYSLLMRFWSPPNDKVLGVILLTNIRSLTTSCLTLLLLSI
ncbi:hypothetical protein CCANI_10435 [Corynebacterium canis]|nr:hypothetical protein CCANI_10435 [Corynebacterium canis]